MATRSSRTSKVQKKFSAKPSKGICIPCLYHKAVPKLRKEWDANLKRLEVAQRRANTARSQANSSAERAKKAQEKVANLNNEKANQARSKADEAKRKAEQVSRLADEIAGLRQSAEQDPRNARSLADQAERKAAEAERRAREADSLTQEAERLAEEAAKQHLIQQTTSLLPHHRGNCSGFTRAVAQAYGIQDFNGKNANKQCEYMAANWRQVSPQEAQALANRGVLVVAGQPAQPNGHVAVIFPDDKSTGNPAPKTIAGSIGGPSGYSDGSKTANQIFLKEPPVAYYTPK